MNLFLIWLDYEVMEALHINNRNIDEENINNLNYVIFITWRYIDTSICKHAWVLLYIYFRCLGF